MKFVCFLILSSISINLMAMDSCLSDDSMFANNKKSPDFYFDLDKLSLVDTQIESDIANGFSGAELLIIRNNDIVKYSVYGYSQRYDQQNKILSNPQAMSCNTLFDLASNTKMYATNYAIMHLVYQKKIDIDKPVNFYIPEYVGCDSNGRCREARTVRNLLSHTAGYMPDPQFFNPQSIQKYGDFYSQNKSLTESIIITKLPFDSDIGSKPKYSDVDFMLLGFLIERVSGQNLDVYLKQNIYDKLGLTKTYFNPLDNGFSSNECAATELQGNTRNRTVNFPNIRTDVIKCQVHDEKAFYSMGGVSGHAGLFSTANELAVLTSVAANNGCYKKVCLWDKKTQKIFTSPLEQDSTFGLGWRRAGDKQNYAPFGDYASNLAYGHTGWIGTVTLIDPKYNLTIILLTNKKHSIFNNGKFAGDKFATGQYAPIIDLIYKAMKN